MKRLAVLVLLVASPLWAGIFDEPGINRELDRPKTRGRLVKVEAKKGYVQQVSLRDERGNLSVFRCPLGNDTKVMYRGKNVAFGFFIGSKTADEVILALDKGMCRQIEVARMGGEGDPAFTFINLED